MMRLFRATAVSILLVAACGERTGRILEPVPAPAPDHVPGEPLTVHSVGVQVNGSNATIIWHVDPFNMGEGYAVEAYAGATCAGTNLVPGGASLPGTPWTRPLHLFVNVGPLAAGDYCARVKSNGMFSPPMFQAFIAVRFSIGSANSPPEAGFTAPASALEGDAVEFEGVAEDPDGDALSFQWEIDGEPVSTARSFTHVFEDDGEYEVTFLVSDGRGGSATAARSIAVGNVPPLMVATAAATGTVPVPAGVPFDVSGAFTDPGILDTHSLSLDCNDGGSPIAGAKTGAVRPQYAGTCEWSGAGTYRVRVTLTDDDGGTDSRVTATVVVFLPGTGQVTGGGWIDSPAGACQLTPACAAVEGRGTFGFVSKYGDGAALPKGNLTFQLTPGLFTFRAAAQLWLSVQGPVARLGGTGTIDGEGSYEFVLTAVDGAGGNADGFRLWIRDPASGSVVYDSRPGTDPYSDEVTGLAGGSIVIHKGR